LTRSKLSAQESTKLLSLNVFCILVPQHIKYETTLNCNRTHVTTIIMNFISVKNRDITKSFLLFGKDIVDELDLILERVEPTNNRLRTNFLVRQLALCIKKQESQAKLIIAIEEQLAKVCAFIDRALTLYSSESNSPRRQAVASLSKKLMELSDAANNKSKFILLEKIMSKHGLSCDAYRQKILHFAIENSNWQNFNYAVGALTQDLDQDRSSIKIYNIISENAMNMRLLRKPGTNRLIDLDINLTKLEVVHPLFKIEKCRLALGGKHNIAINSAITEFLTADDGSHEEPFNSMLDPFMRQFAREKNIDTYLDIELILTKFSAQNPKFTYQAFALALVHKDLNVALEILERLISNKHNQGYHDKIHKSLRAFMIAFSEDAKDEEYWSLLKNLSEVGLDVTAYVLPKLSDLLETDKDLTKFHAILKTFKSSSGDADLSILVYSATKIYMKELIKNKNYIRYTQIESLMRAYGLSYYVYINQCFHLNIDFSCSI